VSLELIKFAFVAGELSQTFLGRSDLEKFDLGLQEAVNWFVDYRGGLSTRAGTEFLDYVKHPNDEVKLFPFKYAPNVANTYVVMFGKNYIRFLQDGGYVLEAAKTVTGVTNTNPAVITSIAHGYANDDWVKFSISGMPLFATITGVVKNVTANTFELFNVFDEPINTTLWGTFVSGTVSRVYTLATPYASADLEKLSLFQQRDLIKITSVDFPIYELTRIDAANWTLLPAVIGNLAAVPVNLVTTPIAAGTSAVGFIVTSVDLAGNESLASKMKVEVATSNYASTAGGIQLSWDGVANTKHYNVYRTNIINAQAYFSSGAEVGFVGRAYGTRFTDNNIIPDFTQTPPIESNPFKDGAVSKIEIGAGGTLYPRFATTVSVTGGGGTGFVGEPLVDAVTGAVFGVLVINSGKGYSSPVVTFSGGGSGATATALLSALSGNNPALSGRFQQRQLYAATLNAPLTVYGSKPRRHNNFDMSNIVADNDTYEFDIDSDEVAPIRHVQSVRGGLLLMTDAGIWQLTGGGVNDPVTPTNALAEPQTYTGISEVPPLLIDTDLIYIESKGYTVRALSYNDFSRVYAGTDISILSNHFFSAQNRITRWGFASDPFKLVWACRSDGAMLMFTMVKEQNVFAWTRAYTKGQFKDILPIQENRTDTVYTLVRRRIAGRWVKYIERFAPRVITHVEEAFAVDCGLKLNATYPAAGVEMSGITGIIICTADAPVFSALDVGKVFRAGGCKGVVTVFTDTTHITVLLQRDVALLVPEDEDLTPLPAAQGTWTLDTPVSSVSGLWHLEGQRVSILQDGNVIPKQIVTGGRIILQGTATRVIVGLPFVAKAKTLPMSVERETIENRRKRIMGIGVRVHESRGLKAGGKYSKLYEVKERTSEIYSEPTNLISAMKNVLIQPQWNVDGSSVFVQDNPLPATILGFVTSTEVGDDPD
jgi:hypothetical protein